MLLKNANNMKAMHKLATAVLRFWGIVHVRIDKYKRKKGTNKKQCPLGRCFFKETREKKYRSWSEVPPDAAKLVDGLTMRNEEERLTVRDAQLNNWISGDGYELPRGDFPCRHSDEIVFLDLSSRIKATNIKLKNK